MGKVIDFNEGWIPVSKRLPKQGQAVQLKGVPTGCKEEVILDTQYHEKVGIVPNVTHWRPR